MAHSLEEGSTDTGISKISTEEWLKENNLSHLIPDFKQNNMSISELSEMSRDDLTDTLKALGINAINLPRVRNKIMKLKKNTDNDNDQKTQIQQIIITEAEQTAMKSLNHKFEELKQQQTSIENSLNEIEKEHIKQQKLVKSSVNEIISKIQERSDILLNDMNNKVNQYKNELAQILQQNESHCSSLIKVQNQYEFNIRESAKASPSMSKSMDILQKRSNKNVLMIDGLLLNMKMESNDDKYKTKRITFNIDKHKIINDINKWGKVTLTNDTKLPSFSNDDNSLRMKLVFCDDKTGFIDADGFIVKVFPDHYTFRDIVKDVT